SARCRRSRRGVLRACHWFTRGPSEKFHPLTDFTWRKLRFPQAVELGDPLVLFLAQPGIQLLSVAQLLEQLTRHTQIVDIAEHRLYGVEILQPRFGSRPVGRFEQLECVAEFLRGDAKFMQIGRGCSPTGAVAKAKEVARAVGKFP